MSVNKGWYWLLLIPFIGTLWVPFYNFNEPTAFGFPFFYWYQLLCIPITSLITLIVYLKTKPQTKTPGE
jgi:hypothetical protein